MIDIRCKFGKAIKKLRENRALSQEDFSFKIGMDRSYFASVEVGRRNISLINIEKIARGFGITIAELFSSIEEPSEDE